jgi:hypothetical protein
MCMVAPRAQTCQSIPVREQACSWQQNPAYTSDSLRYGKLSRSRRLANAAGSRRIGVTKTAVTETAGPGDGGMKRRTFITLLALGPVAACARPVHATIRGLTMGTSYTVELAAPMDDATRTGLKELIDAELAAINQSMSTYDPRSELSQFNRRQDLRWVPASPGTARGAR